jgi:predicted transcriptional regulator
VSGENVVSSMSESPVSVLPLFARRESMLVLLRDDPHSKSELVDSLDVSRSTVDRCVRELESFELVERVDGGFQLTLAGRLLLEQYERYRECAAGVVRSQAVLSALPTDTDLDATALCGASVTLADRTAPYRPAEEYLESVRTADRVDHVTTALSPQYVEGFREAIVDRGVEVRLAATESISRRLVTDHSDTLAELFESGRLTMRELDAVPAFSLGIVERDDRVSAHYLVYADDGIRGRIETAHPDAATAARETFEEYWATGTPVGGAER